MVNFKCETSLWCKQIIHDVQQIEKVSPESVTLRNMLSHNHWQKAGKNPHLNCYISLERERETGMNVCKLLGFGVKCNMLDN